MGLSQKDSLIILNHFNVDYTNKSKIKKKANQLADDFLCKSIIGSNINKSKTYSNTKVKTKARRRTRNTRTYTKI
jgi:hypothetical protein